MVSFKDLERRALCPHTYRSKEVMYGYKTGDSICNECGELFVPNEEITPPEYRIDMIISVHALRIALLVNKNLKLVKNFKNDNDNIYDWALIDDVNNFSIPIISKIAAIAISEGYAKE